MTAYCDRAMHTIGAALKEDDYFHHMGPTLFDLYEDGSFKSTKKTKFFTDLNGKQYKITIEEA